MAKAQGLSRMTVQRIWNQYNLKPHLIETFKLSRDKHFLEKLQDIVGLYLNPPDHALVLCVDEKSQIHEPSEPNYVVVRRKVGVGGLVAGAQSAVASGPACPNHPNGSRWCVEPDDR